MTATPGLDGQTGATAGANGSLRGLFRAVSPADITCARMMLLLSYFLYAGQDVSRSGNGCGQGSQLAFPTDAEVYCSNLRVRSAAIAFRSWV